MTWDPKWSSNSIGGIGRALGLSPQRVVQLIDANVVGKTGYVDGGHSYDETNELHRQIMDVLKARAAAEVKTSTE